MSLNTFHNLRKYYFVFLLLNFFSVFCQNPTNIPGIKLWLKSDAGITLNGSNISSWNDQSGNSQNTIQSDINQQPLFVSNVLNNLPALRFNGNNVLKGGTIPSLSSSSLSMFIVTSGSSMSDPYNILFDIGPYVPGGMWLSKNSNKFTVYSNNAIYAPAVGTLSNTGFPPSIFGYKKDFNVISESFINTLSVANSTNSAFTGPFTNGPFIIGGDTTFMSNSGGKWNGDIFEIILFDRALSNSEIKLINDYLINRYTPFLNLGADIVIPQNTGCVPSFSISIIANPDFQTYLWSTGITSNQINVNQYGEYSVICTDVFGINHYDTIKVIPSVKNFNYPSNNALCGNNTFTWNTQLNKIENQFQWQDNSTDSLFVISSPGQYYVTVTDTFGCAYISNTLTVVQDNFSATASLGPDVSLCSGNSITLTSGATPSLTYTWSTGSNNDSLLITTSGPYSVVVTNTNNCIAKDTINVTISGQAPTANFSFSVGCKNTAVSFTNLSIPPLGNSIDSTIWSFGDLSASNTSTLSNPFHTFSDTGTYSIKLKVITNVGCEQTITKTIRIAPTPTVNFSSGISCQNDSTAFSSSIISSPGYSITSLFWNFGDPASGSANTSNLLSPKHLFSNQAIYTIKLVATNNVGCKDSLLKYLDVSLQFCQNPTNIPGIKLWLKSDAGITLNGSNISSWNDQSGNSQNTIQSDINQQPLFVSNVLNNLPALRFNGNNVLKGGTIPSLSSSSLSMFIVTSGSSMSDPYNILFDIGPYVPGGMWLSKNSNKFTVYSNNAIYAPAVGTLSNTGFPPSIFGYKKDFNVISESFINTLSVANSTNSAFTGPFTNGPFIIGGDTTFMSNSGGKWNGDIFEIILFDRALSNSEIKLINDYLINRYTPFLNLGADIVIPQNTGCVPSFSISIIANPDFQTYLWSTGITSNQINVNQYGEYSVICTDVFGINHYDTIKVIPSVKNFNYPSNNALCGNNTFTWNTQLNKIENQFQWQDNSTDSLFVISSPGQYYVTVTDTFGCAYISNTLTVVQDNFSATASLGPDVSLCSGNSITLTSGATPSLTYTWSTGSNNDSLLITTSGPYSVVVTNTNNCIAKDTINVTISGQAPTANFSFSVGCKNTAVSLTNLSIPPLGNSIDSTIWSFGDLSASNTSTLSNPFHTFSDTGTYSIKLKVITNVGCEQTITKTIRIAPTPTVNFSSGISCQNDSTAFSSSIISSPGYSITSLFWNFGDPASGSANTSNLLSPKHLFSNQTTYFVTLVATNNAGCATSLTKSISVKAEVTASFTNSPPCSNTSTIFQDNSIAPLGSARSWNFGNSTSTGVTATKTYTSSGVYSVTLTVTGTNFCTSKITKQIIVFLPPAVNFTVPSFCSKDTITATNQSLAQSGIISSYNWKLNNTTFSAAQNPTLTVTSAGTYSVKLIVVNSFSCKDSLTKPVTVLPLPNVDFTTNPPSYYFIDSTVNFIPTITNASSYLWNVTSFPASTIQSPTVSFNTEGSYTVSLNLKDQQGCKNSKTKTITISKRYLDLAVLNVNTIKDNDGFITVAADIVNYGTVPVASFDIHYQISDAGNIKETWNGTLNPNAFYIYTFTAKSASQKNNTNNITCVEIEKANGVIDENTSNNNLCSTLNTDEISVSNPIPNPTDADITLPIILNKDIDFTVAIYNSIGQIIYEETSQKGTTGLNLVTLPTSSYARGCYIIKTMIDGKTFIKKFIKISSK